MILVDRLLLRRVLSQLEASAGPVYEPDRPRPIVSEEELWSRVGLLEAFLRNVLMLSRLEILLVSAGSLWFALGVFLPTLLEPPFIPSPEHLVSLAVMIVLPPALSLLIGDRCIWYWTLPASGGTWTPEMVGQPFLGVLPDARAVVDAQRRFYDALVAFDQGRQPGLVASLKGRGYPLVAYACRVSWSLVPSWVKRKAS